jgi:fructose-1,6-bisphosphatase/inositol monophosphatase family enzyme
MIQEVLLLAAMETLDPRRTTLDAEEATSTVGRFATRGGDATLVIDPLDGTLEYLAQRESYSINVGLVESGRVRAALVYFPARDDLYFLAADGRGYLASQARQTGLSNATALTIPALPAPLIYKNSRVSGAISHSLTDLGMTVSDDTDGNVGCADALLRVLSGEATAYIAHTRQMRDVLLGAIVGSAEGGTARDWRGHDLRWPESGRVARAIFGGEAACAPVIERLAGHDG